MKTQTLLKIKRQLGKFHELVHSVASYWEFSPYYITVSVLLQNMAFDRECSHEEKEKELYRIRDILHNFSQYYRKNHFVQWVYDEVDMIISGECMSEEEDDQEDYSASISDK